MKKRLTTIIVCSAFLLNTLSFANPPRAGMQATPSDGSSVSDPNHNKADSKFVGSKLNREELLEKSWNFSQERFKSKSEFRKKAESETQKDFDNSDFAKSRKAEWMKQNANKSIRELQSSYQSSLKNSELNIRVSELFKSEMDYNQRMTLLRDFLKTKSDTKAAKNEFDRLMEERDRIYKSNSATPAQRDDIERKLVKASRAIEDSKKLATTASKLLSVIDPLLEHSKDMTKGFESVFGNPVSEPEKYLEKLSKFDPRELEDEISGLFTKSDNKELYDRYLTEAEKLKTDPNVEALLPTFDRSLADFLRQQKAKGVDTEAADLFKTYNIKPTQRWAQYEALVSQIQEAAENARIPQSQALSSLKGKIKDTLISAMIKQSNDPTSKISNNSGNKSPSGRVAANWENEIESAINSLNPKKQDLTKPDDEEFDKQSCNVSPVNRDAIDRLTLKDIEAPNELINLGKQQIVGLLSSEISLEKAGAKSRNALNRISSAAKKVAELEKYHRLLIEETKNAELSGNNKKAIKQAKSDQKAKLKYLEKNVKNLKKYSKNLEKLTVAWQKECIKQAETSQLTPAKKSVEEMKSLAGDLNSKLKSINLSNLAENKRDLYDEKHLFFMKDIKKILGGSQLPVGCQVINIPVEAHQARVHSQFKANSVRENANKVDLKDEIKAARETLQKIFQDDTDGKEPTVRSTLAKIYQGLLQVAILESGYKTLKTMTSNPEVKRSIEEELKLTFKLRDQLNRIIDKQLVGKAKKEVMGLGNEKKKSNKDKSKKGSDSAPPVYDYN